MTFVPDFKLYDSGGTLIYTFPLVQYTNAPVSNKKFVEITGQRGKGSIVIDGGEAPFNITIRGLFYASDDYESIASDIDSLESTVEFNTPYILRIDKSESSYYEYYVKRLKSINYQESLRLNKQIYEVTLRANTWG